MLVAVLVGVVVERRGAKNLMGEFVNGGSTDAPPMPAMMVWREARGGAFSSAFKAMLRKQSSHDDGEDADCDDMCEARRI